MTKVVLFISILLSCICSNSFASSYRVPLEFIIKCEANECKKEGFFATYKRKCDVCKHQLSMPSDSKIFKLNQDVELPKENGKILDGFYAISSDWETPLVAHDDGLKYSKCFNLTERDEVVIKCKNTYLKKLNFLATESLTSVQASYIAESKKLDIIHFSIFTLPMILFIMLIILNSIPFQFRHKSKLKYIIGFLAFIGIFSVISISHSPFFGIGTVGVIYYFILGLIFAFRKLKRLFLKH